VKKKDFFLKFSTASCHGAVRWSEKVTLALRLTKIIDTAQAANYRHSASTVGSCQRGQLSRSLVLVCVRARVCVLCVCVGGGGGGGGAGGWVGGWVWCVCVKEREREHGRWCVCGVRGREDVKRRCVREGACEDEDTFFP
jgi:hypothetical protein